MSDQGELQRKHRELELRKAKKKLEYELPHLHGQKLYTWQRRWIESNNEMNLMNKGNQVGGSTASIKKAIIWSTDTKLRMKLFGKTPEEPIQLLYFMPSLNLFAREFHEKWIPHFMPRGDSKLTGPYSWTAEYDQKALDWINFIRFPEANATIFTLSYGSDPHKSMQAMTPDAIFADEEMPEHIWGEIYARLSSKFATKRAYFHMTCTPTRGEKLWDAAFNENRFPGAMVMNVSQYDCLKFEDGSPGVHTIEGINKFKQGLPDERSIQIRVFGKYAKAEGLVFESFDAAKNVKPRMEMGPDSTFYSGLDYGSGGTTGHPAAIAIIEVSQNRKKAQLHKFWKGNKLEKTDPTSIINQYLRMKGSLAVAGEYYDWASSDLGTVGASMGVAVQKADKSREFGIGLMNSLFKNEMLNIPKEPEFEPFVKELEGLRAAQKRKDGDDGCDAVRYSISRVVFDLSDVKFKPTMKNEEEAPRPKERTTGEYYESYSLTEDIEHEIQEFNDLLDY